MSGISLLKFSIDASSKYKMHNSLIRNLKNCLLKLKIFNLIDIVVRCKYIIIVLQD